MRGQSCLDLVHLLPEFSKFNICAGRDPLIQYMRGKGYLNCIYVLPEFSKLIYGLPEFSKFNLCAARVF